MSCTWHALPNNSINPSYPHLRSQQQDHDQLRAQNVQRHQYPKQKQQFTLPQTQAVPVVPHSLPEILGELPYAQYQRYQTLNSPDPATVSDCLFNGQRQPIKSEGNFNNNIHGSPGFEFALEAEKMVSELCSSTVMKDGHALECKMTSSVGCGENRRPDQRRRPAETTPPDEMLQSHPSARSPSGASTLCTLSPAATQTPRTATQCLPQPSLPDQPPPARFSDYSRNLCPGNAVPGTEPQSFSNGQLSFRDLVIRGCLELEHILKTLKRNVYVVDLIYFCLTVRESVGMAMGYDFNKPCDETRPLIIAFFRLASCWLGMFPCLESPSLQPALHAAFKEWQAASRRAIYAILKSIPFISNRVDQRKECVDVSHGPPPPAPRQLAHFQENSQHWKQNRFGDSTSKTDKSWPRCPETVDQPGWANPEVCDPLITGSSTVKSYWHVAKDIPSHESENIFKGFNGIYGQFPERTPDPQLAEEKKPIQNFFKSIQERGKVSNEYYRYNETTTVSTPPPSPTVGQVTLLSPPDPRFPQRHVDNQLVDLESLFQGYRKAYESVHYQGYPKTEKQSKESVNRHANTSYNLHQQINNRYNCQEVRQSFTKKNKVWFNRNQCTPSMNWSSNPNMSHCDDSSDEVQDGAYMKPGSYDVPKRYNIPPPGLGRTQPLNPEEHRDDSSDIAWQAALASAESLCKALQSNETDHFRPPWESFAEKPRAVADVKPKSISIPCSPISVMNSTQVAEQINNSCKVSEAEQPGVVDILESPCKNDQKTSRVEESQSQTKSLGERQAPLERITVLKHEGRQRNGEPKFQPTKIMRSESEKESLLKQSRAKQQRQAPTPTSVPAPQRAGRARTRSRSASLGSWRPLRSIPASGRPRRVTSASVGKLQGILNSLWDLEESKEIKYSPKDSFDDQNWQPTSLDALARKLKNRAYETLDQFVEDFRFILVSRQANRENSNKTKVDSMKTLERKFNNLLEKNFDAWGCGSLTCSNNGDTDEHDDKLLKHPMADKAQE